MPPLRKPGFLTIGLFDENDPRPGHEVTLEVIDLGERLGFDCAWVRHRHLQSGISSPVAVLAAASQCTSTLPRSQTRFTQTRRRPTFRASHPDGAAARVCQGLVVIHTDSASPRQRAKYQEYARRRLPRTTAPQGRERMLLRADFAGTAAQIAEQLQAQAAFREVTEVAFALPFSFARDDYVQILTDMATRLGPARGWRPSS